MLLFTVLVFIITAVIVSILSLVFGLNLMLFLIRLLSISLLAAFFSFFIFYIYPISKTNRRRSNIEANLPFAMTHMAAIASSGVPPYSMFKILAKFREYGEISKEAEKVVRNIDLFGLDEIRALKEVISRTPSRSFKEFLQGILSTVKTGGSLELFLKQQSEKALFEYRVNRERYTHTLETYADFYTALLIAAPLILITILLIINVVGGQLFGFPVTDLITIGIFVVIPVLNILFLLFIHSTQPKM